MKKQDLMQKITSLCKRRGFIFPACEIYGGFANTYSYGPYGVELKNNIKKLWWKKFVQERADIVGIDGPILLHPKVWEASGHTAGFNDALVDCKECKKRFRADHLVEKLTGKDMEGDLEGMTKILQNKEMKCPECNKSNWTEARNINMMFRTEINGFAGPVYLRPETAGAIFIEFKNIIDSMRIKIPFGVAQSGKAFRNEIVARNFIFRIREFEMMEIEYFFDPKEEWKPLFDNWLDLQGEFAHELGINDKDLRHKEHSKEKLAHYSQKTVDVEYNFPFGFSELFGLAHRGNFDLSQHGKVSGKKLEYFDVVNNKCFIPHVIEPTFGVDRSLLAAICSAYTEEKVAEEERIVLKLPFRIAPIKVAVFPLLSNKFNLVNKAKEIFGALKNNFMCEFDGSGNIGKRYRRQDEIGTPFCVTIDFDTLEDGAVTIRNRDTMEQERIQAADLVNYLQTQFR